MQPGVVGLRGALIAAWEEDLRAVRRDEFDVGCGREALVFMQRFYGLISGLRAVIQRAWGTRGHVHVVVSSELGGPGCRVSQSRIRLRNRGEAVAVALFSYGDGTSRANPSAGLDRAIPVVGVEPFAYATDLYRTAVDFLSLALGLDLGLAGSVWLYEHVAVLHFLETGRWPLVGDVYRSATREFAVGDSYESVLALFGASVSSPNSSSNGAVADADMALSLSVVQRYGETQADLENFLKVVRMAVEADQGAWRVTSVQVADALGLDDLSVIRVGQLIAASPDVCREGSFSADFAEWSFLPSYNVHFFRRVHAIDDFLAVEASLMPRAAKKRSARSFSPS